MGEALSNFAYATESLSGLSERQIGAVYRTPIDLRSSRAAGDSRWAIAFAVLSSIEHMLSDDIPHTGLRKIYYVRRCCLLEWIIKLKWEPRRKIQIAPHGGKTAFKPCGELWRCVIDMTEQIPDLTPRKDAPDIYQKSAPEVFGMVFTEAVLGGTSLLQGKAADIKRLKQENAALRRYENPFDPIKTPASYQLIDGAINRAEATVGDSRGFKRRAWDEFLKARRQVVVELESGRTLAIREKEGKFFVNSPLAKKSLKEIQEVDEINLDALKRPA